MSPWYLASDMINGIPLTRYIASWYIAGGTPYRPKIRKWLESLIINGRHLTEEEVEVITECVAIGKLELQESAKKFV